MSQIAAMTTNPPTSSVTTSMIAYGHEMAVAELNSVVSGADDLSPAEIEDVSHQLENVTQLLLSTASPQEDAVRDVLEITTHLAKSVSTESSLAAAEVLVSVAVTLGDLVSIGLAEDEVKTVVASDGTSLEVMGLAEKTLTRGFSLGSFEVPGLEGEAFHAASVQVITWASNPYGQTGNEGSGTMVSFSVRANNSEVDLANLDPPLSFAIKDGEVMGLSTTGSNVTLVRRRCAFWNATRGEWSSSGLEVVRKNLTNVVCSSTHATSFAIGFHRSACPFCTSPVPPAFFILLADLNVSMTGVWLISLGLLVFYVPCCCLMMLDRRDWRHVQANQEAYFLPPRPIKRRRGWRKRKTTQRAPRSVSRMQIRDFDAAFGSHCVVVRAVLKQGRPRGSKKLVIHPILGCRIGMHLVVNPGGETHECHVVDGFVLGAVLIKTCLQHEHVQGELVTASCGAPPTQDVDDAQPMTVEPGSSKASIFEDEEIILECCSQEGSEETRASGSFCSEAGATCCASFIVDVVEDEERADDAIEPEYPEDKYFGDDTATGRNKDMACKVMVDPACIRLVFADNEVKDFDRRTCGNSSKPTHSTSQSGEEDAESTAGILKSAEQERAETNRDAIFAEECFFAIVASDDAHKSTATSDGGRGNSNPSTGSSDIAASLYLASANVCGILWNLVLYLKPHWLVYEVSMRRTQRYGVFLTGVVVGAFVQCSIFVMGDGCQHEPLPAVCQKSTSFVDWSRFVQSAWGLAFSGPVMWAVFRLFLKAPRHGTFTQEERDATVRRWKQHEYVAGMLLVIVHSFCFFFFISFVHFYSWHVIWKWVCGSMLSTLATTLGSPANRAVNFFVLEQLRGASRGTGPS